MIIFVGVLRGVAVFGSDMLVPAELLRRDRTAYGVDDYLRCAPEPLHAVLYAALALLCGSRV